VVLILIFLFFQMCEQAAEAQKSKGSLGRRGRTSSDPSGNSRDSISVDAILSKNLSTSVLVSSSTFNIYHVLPPFQIIRRSGFSRYIVFAIHKTMYLEKPERLIIWNGGSI
jgi:hypothetical protein